MLIDGKECCTSCGVPTIDCGALDGNDTCSLCREKERKYDAGYHDALRTMFDQVAELIEEDGGLDLIDLVCDRNREKRFEIDLPPQPSAERRVVLSEAAGMEDVAEVMRASAGRIEGAGPSEVAQDLRGWAARLAAAAGERRAARGAEPV